MKAGELKKATQAFEPFFPTPWKRLGHNFVRVHGDWVQMVAFYRSRWDSRYQPRSCFEFLKDPGDFTFGYLGCPLVYSRSGTERWVEVSQTARSISALFNDMVAEFKPSIVAPLGLREIKRLLEAEIEYWPHAYALCVMAAEAGQKNKAQRYLAAFESDVADRPSDWFEKERRELKTCLKEMGTHALSERLEKVKSKKLRALKI
jgi:hypothetical protein